MSPFLQNATSVVATIALILGIVGLFTGGEFQPLAGETHFSGPLDTTEGYKVDDTIVIDADGNVDAPVTSGSASTFADTVDITGNTTVGGTLGITGETTCDTLVQGGSVYTTTTMDTALNLTAAQICDNSIIIFGPDYETLNVTLPASTTLAADCLSTIGDHKSILFQNTASSSPDAANITIVAGTGIKTISDDTSGDVFADDAAVELEFWNIATTGDWTVIIRPFTDAD